MSQGNVWKNLLEEASAASAREHAMAPALHDAILGRRDFAAALAHRVATGLGLPADAELARVVADAFTEDATIIEAAEADIAGIAARDPSLSSLLPVFLHFKGYLAVQAWRVAHWLWRRGRCGLAELLQTTAAQATGVSLDPSASLGSAVFLDHGTGIVIGPHVRVGNGTTIFQNVLIGRSAEAMDSAPAIGNGCFIGSDAIVLGPITVGDGAKIGAGTLVDRDVPAGCTAVGVPMRLVNCAAPVEQALLAV